MWKTFVRPAMIFVPLTLGVLCPACHVLGFLIRWCLVTMLFMVFLGLNVKELAPRKSQLLILLANLLMGIVPYFILHLCGANDALAKAVFFVGITPTATAAAVVMGFLGGNVGYVLSSFILTNVGISLFLPGLMPFVCGEISWAFALKVVETLLFVLAMPLGLASVVKRFYPAAKVWPKKLATPLFGLWSLMLFIIAAQAGEFFRTNPDASWWLVAAIALGSLVICAANFSLGYLLGEKNLKHEASQSLGQKNTTLTIYLALTYAGPLAAMGPIFYVLWHNSWNGIQIYFADRKKRQKELQEK